MLPLFRFLLPPILLLFSLFLFSSEKSKVEIQLDSLTIEIKTNWMNNPDRALELIDKAEKIARKYPSRFAEVLKFRGVVYYFKSDYGLAKQFYTQSLGLYTELSDSAGISALLNNLAIIAVETGEYNEGVKLYLEALRIAEKLGDRVMIGRIYLNLGNISSELGQTDKSLVHYQKALEYSDSISQKGVYASLLNNIGGSYSDLEDFKKAFDFHSRSLKMRKELGDSIPIATSLSNLANVLVNQKKTDEAIKMYNLALEIYTKLGYKKGMVSTYNFLGNCYLSLGDNVKAGDYFAKNINEAEELHSGYWEAQGYGSLASAFYKSGFFEKAYDALLKFQQINDSLQVEESRRHLTELETKYETQKKEAEIQRLSAEKLQQEKKLVIRTAWLLAAVIAALIAIIVLVVIRNRQHRKTAALDKKNLEMENQLLRVQMNPHFLFNSLNSIQYYMDKKPESASRYLTKFSRLTRLILEHSRNHWVNLSEEIESMKLYLEIEQLRLENKFKWDFKIAEEIEEDMMEVPPMMFQPFIENAIKHGVLPRESGGQINVVLSLLEGSKLKVTITDNGVGRAKGQTDHTHHSLGTQLTKERIALFEKQYNASLSLKINDIEKAGIPQGTKVEMEIPYRDL
jgi:tetratricopeptide (TPR) repeat protein